MPRTRDDQQHEAFRNRVLDVARQQMVQHGTAGLSLRSIARELDVTAPALYRYFPKHDDLITALVVEGFTALAEALEAARDAYVDAPLRHQLTEVLLAYRRWAVTHPVDFNLIYGSPIPGYHAPREVTVPAVVRGFSVIVGLIESLIQNGEITQRSPYHQIPAETETYLTHMIANDHYPISTRAFYMGVVGWGQLHGMIMLELFGHLGPVVGDLDAYYHAQVENLLVAMGLDPPNH
jgi:AcrR family transcriptional regulator